MEETNQKPKPLNAMDVVRAQLRQHALQEALRCMTLCEAVLCLIDSQQNAVTEPGKRVE